MKLPKPRKRGDSYRIEIMLDGQRYSATRDTAQECTKWASQKLLEHKAGILQKDDKPKTMTFGELLTLHHEKVGKKKRSARTTIFYVRTLIRDFPTLANMPISDITARDLTEWRNKRLESVSAGTVRREISHYSSVMSYAVKELFIVKENPFANLVKPPAPKPRERRITNNEIDIILQAGNYKLGQTPRQSQQYAVWAFLFAIHTGMRISEILRVRKSDIHENYLFIPESKNDTARHVPFTNELKEILSWINHDDERLIPLTTDAFKNAWKRVQRKANIDNLHFHDTRHEGASRFVRDLGLPVETLAKVTGHKDIRTLINTYYNPTIDELVDLFQK